MSGPLLGLNMSKVFRKVGIILVCKDSNSNENKVDAAVVFEKVPDSHQERFKSLSILSKKPPLLFIVHYLSNTMQLNLNK